MKLAPLPADFVRDHLDLSWEDIVWGYHEGWLDAREIVALATAEVAREERPAPALLELAGLSVTDLARVPQLLDVIAAGCPADEARSSARWLYLVLAWLFEHKEEVEDPLGLVEQVYADFGYPPQMASFVRYMPPQKSYEPRSYTRHDNEKRLFEEWESYLRAFETDAPEPEIS